MIREKPQTAVVALPVTFIQINNGCIYLSGLLDPATYHYISAPYSQGFVISQKSLRQPIPELAIVQSTSTKYLEHHGTQVGQVATECWAGIDGSSETRT
jgi:hypothetical protein